jgi:gentisate 1,2-dioxygenase
MKIFPPGGFQSMHAHPGEAWLYIIEGRGHSYFGSEPTGGQTVRWQAGDLVCVDHHCWHQHFNDDPDDVVRMIRVHMVDSVNMILRAVADPMVLTLEPKWALEQVPDISAVEFPKEHRPLPS